MEEPDVCKHELTQSVEHLTSSGRSLTKPELVQTRRIARFAVEQKRARVIDLLKENSNGANLIAYGSDGWSGHIATRTRECIGQHLTVTRKGRFYHEVLLEHAFVRARRPDGSEQVEVVLDRPRGLSKGQAAWNVFSAATEFFETGRALGCRGVVIQFYCMDKKLFGAFMRHIRARHALNYDETAEDLFEEIEFVPISELDALEWVVGVP